MTGRKFDQLFGGPPRTPEQELRQRDMDLAASIQAVTEEIMMRVVRHVHAQTGQKNLVMAGGVALNCVANGNLLREGPFEHLWIQPAAGDAGGALGAALFVWHQLLNQTRTVQPTSDSQIGSLLGPAFSDPEIQLFLEGTEANYQQLDDDALMDQVAGLMANQQVIGWFSGRMEFGPRALGARSIIGDARSRTMQRTMNTKIKFRESFRPFAPVVLAEHADQYFELAPGEESPYMLIVADVRDDKRSPLSEEQESLTGLARLDVVRSQVPAITHVDFSARVQTVDRIRHPRFHRLLNAFYEKTNCPVAINTSFNVRGEPIVCTPEDAYRCFLATDMDVLVLGNHLLLKKNQPESLSKTEARDYVESFDLD